MNMPPLFSLTTPLCLQTSCFRETTRAVEITSSSVAVQAKTLSLKGTSLAIHLPYYRPPKVLLYFQKLFRNY
jgi:hypothetical protein